VISPLPFVIIKFCGEVGTPTGVDAGDAEATAERSLSPAVFVAAIL